MLPSTNVTGDDRGCASVSAGFDHDRVPALEAETGREVQVTVVPYYQREQMKEEGNPFVASVLRNHIFVGGATL